jgi:pyruvate, orthophosphate dikinase
MGDQLIYRFGGAVNEGSAAQGRLLGNKGANLAEMARLGVSVPAGFTLATSACGAFFQNNNELSDALVSEIKIALADLAQTTAKNFGGAKSPLFLSVRASSEVAIPGLMDTLLKIGFNDETVAALAAESGNPIFAYQSYCRFIEKYADAVLGLDHLVFEDGHGASDVDRPLAHWQDLAKHFQATVLAKTGTAFPQDVYVQLTAAIATAFASWQSPRAKTYRSLNGLTGLTGTALTIQAMVFGKADDQSAAGIASSRDPATGAKTLHGLYLPNASGIDLTSGLRPACSVTTDLAANAPQLFQQLVQTLDKLERHFCAPQTVEFTIESGKLWFLQTRALKSSTLAAMKISVDMVAEGLITTDDAIMRIDPLSLDPLLHPTLDPDAPRSVFGLGLAASPGAASGMIVFDTGEAELLKALGHAVILVRVETSPEDIHGMHAAEAVLTTRGGITSHAAVVARGMGKPCITGAGSLRVDMQAQTLTSAGVMLKKGDLITIDGSSGQILNGAIPSRQPELSGDFATIMVWADKARRMKVRANAETLHDANMAKDFGADGIGLCRTEHMFFEQNRIVAMREMILADKVEDRRAALAKILPMQRGDFISLFEVMVGLPVNIRLLDPPLHEFLPQTESEIAAVADAMDTSVKLLRARVNQLQELNPMLGHRGVRLAISYPEIAEMQARAIFEAMVEVSKRAGGKVPIVEIMVPLVSVGSELDVVGQYIRQVAEDVQRESGVTLHYLIGTMIELPRAALMAGEIANTAEFFSFGTNDLTQTTFGISRDDSARFIGEYTAKGIFPRDPFISLDLDGVGELMKIATQRGRATRADLKLGICGEHGGDPGSIAFCEQIGLDYVSCSPYRVPIARLATAQATIRNSRK